jgi:hypothetical protein
MKASTESDHAQRRVARVFVSSTFLDAAEERNVLATRVFPDLRRLCRARGVTFVDVDLRWGITVEQEAEGDILPVCLSEIDRCRPFFVGIICDRYGWVPDAFEPADLQRFPWLADYAGHSITELEMLHGALLDAGSASAAFFYRRAPRDSFPLDRSALDRLADHVRASRLPFVEGLESADQIGDAVLRDLTIAIDRIWPAGELPDEHEARAAAYRFFAQDVTTGYVPHGDVLDSCLAHLSSDGPPLIVSGAEGVGKTALFASVAEAARARGMPVVDVYLGSVPGDTDPRRVVTHVLTAINRLVGKADATVDAGQLAFSMDAGFRAAPQGAVFAVVLDAVDALDDREGALDLTWLPRVVPPNVRLLLSSRSGRPLAAARARGWNSRDLTGLTRDERAAVAEGFLVRYGKRLSVAQLARLSSAGEMQNPLLLRTVLGELRVVGRYETLDRQLDEYLAAPDSGALFDLVLERLEGEAGADGRVIVAAVLGGLWASRYGLSEDEIAASAGDLTAPLSRRALSTLLLNLGEHVRDTNGRLRLASEAFANAVAARYLADENAVRRAHLRLARYFEQTELSPRTIDEYPWQLQQAGALDRLRRFLVQIPVFLAFPAVDGQFRFELAAYWRAIGPHVDPVEDYLAALDAAAKHDLEPDRIAQAIHELAFFFELIDRSDGARQLREYQLHEAERAFGKGSPETALPLNNVAFFDIRSGDRARGARLLRRALKALERGGQESGQLAASILDNLGQIEHEPAKRVQAGRRALDIRRRLLGPEHRVTLRSMNNLAAALDAAGSSDEAIALARETLRIRSDVLGPTDYDTLATATTLALMLLDRGFEEEAIGLAGDAERGLAAILGESHHRVEAPRSIVEVGLIRSGRVAEAETLVARRTPPSAPSTMIEATAANNMGQIRRMQRRFAEAEALIRSAVAAAASPERGDGRLYVLFQISLSEVLVDAGRAADAEVLLGSVDSGFRQRKRMGPLVTARAAYLHARAAAALSDRARALRYGRRALSLRLKYAGASSRLVTETKALIRTLSGTD